MMVYDDDDEEYFGGLYENGKWIWDERAKHIVFISNLHPKSDMNLSMSFTQHPTGKVEFRDDIDLIEQLRYRRNFQRKVLEGQAEIVTLQDVKDLVLYTAPMNFINLKMINMLHKPTTERFLRALILYCAYSFQIQDIMKTRVEELETKVKTPGAEQMEEEYQDNLSDLRVLVAKEYCTMLVGAGDMKAYHHMGANKRRKSLFEKDARTFETFIRISVQIVYLALGRKYFNQIEIETHRLLKSETFNAVERKLQGENTTVNQASIQSRQGNTKAMLMGSCQQRDRQLNTHSPLMKEVFCGRPIDYRLRGLGVVKYPDLTPRLRYFLLAIAGPEEQMAAENLTLGIIGMPRTRFDTMLMLLPEIVAGGKSKGAFTSSQAFSRSGIASKSSIASRSGISSKSSVAAKKLAARKPYPDIVIPPKESVETSAPKGFEELPENIIRVNRAQYKLWRDRFNNMISLLSRRRRGGGRR